MLSSAKLISSVEALAPYLSVDDGLAATTLAKLGASMPNIRAEDIRFFTSPALGTGIVGKASAAYPDWDERAVIA